MVRSSLSWVFQFKCICSAKSFKLARSRVSFVTDDNASLLLLSASTMFAGRCFFNSDGGLFGHVDFNLVLFSVVLLLVVIIVELADTPILATSFLRFLTHLVSVST
jgi:hypothetical protein